jgi:hypothetical protein
MRYPGVSGCWRLLGGLVAVCILFVLPPVAKAQPASAPGAASAAVAPSTTPPAEVVRIAIQNEISDDPHSHLFTWKARRNRGHDTVVEEIVDTPAGSISRLILIDGKPLTPAQRSAEDERIRRMADPAQMRRKKKDQQEDDERTRKILAVIPDAFDFSYLGSTQAPNGHKLTRIHFVARPGFVPPTRESAVFEGMEGEIVVDESAHRLAKIDGTLFREVNFGWGILGKLYKGGRFLIEQSEVSPNHWDTTRQMLHFEGKVLLFKTLHIDDTEISWDYKAVPPMSVEQAMNFLARSGQTPQSALLAP